MTSKAVERAPDQYLLHVYGDSLSLPRNQDGVPFQLTYGELLRKKIGEQYHNKNVYFYNWSRGDATIQTIFDEFKRQCFYFSCKLDMIILQVGVCDCAPRPIPPKLRNFISNLPRSLRLPIIKVIHRFRATVQRNGIYWQNTEPEIFKVKLHDFLSRAVKEADQVYVLNVAPTLDETESHSPGFAEQIRNYNLMLAEGVKSLADDRVKLIDVYEKMKNDPEGLKKYVIADGHHISAASHQLYADLIWAEEIRKK